MGLLARRIGLLARELPVAGAIFLPEGPRTMRPPLGPRKIMRPLASFFPVYVYLAAGISVYILLKDFYSC